LSLDSLAEARRQAEQKGLLHEDPARLIATPQGQLFLNDCCNIF
ncbi:YggW family oxidoreductase, partial [Pseudomonas syringae pv. actinidiae]|nr:YggW family oxidoreductase [Pseudomonas syringae pv. actinidiae]